MIYFIINIFLLILIFIFFDKKINKKLSLKKIQFEINDSINLFNRNLEEKLLKVEGKLKKFNEQAIFIDKKSLELEKLLKNYEERINQKKYFYSGKKIGNNIKKITTSGLTSYKRITNNKKNQIKKIKKSLTAQIIQLSSRGYDTKNIAEKLAISVDEVKLNLLNRM